MIPRKTIWLMGLEEYDGRVSGGHIDFPKLTWNRILMKILEEEVVSSWVRRMLSMTCQLMASCSSSAAKNLATLRSLLVSRRWISEYCRRKHSSKHSWYAGNFSAKRVASSAWYLKAQSHVSAGPGHRLSRSGEAHSCCSPDTGKLLAWQCQGHRGAQATVSRQILDRETGEGQQT